MDPDNIEGVNPADLTLMAQFFKKAMGFQSIPPGRLSKFRGPPYRAGELSFLEWLEEFETVAEQFELPDGEKTRVLIDHLVGAAKEEVACMEEVERKSYTKVVSVLKLCFGAHESVQSLSNSFHNRSQHEGENLSDFSRALKRLYSKMEMAAATQKDSQALKQLRDQALREQFIRGAREVWVRRELRRIDLSTKGKTFDVMREEVLTLFQETEVLPQRSRVREVSVDEVQQSTEVAQSTLISDLIAGQKLLTQEVKNLSRELAAMRDSSRFYRVKEEEATCFNCEKKGHFAKRCPEPNPGRPARTNQRRRDFRPAPNHGQGNF
ncbi:hypothetical protein BSL78_26474 [Apostichopus japonicus]|uniref:CCHC-type domain-containing protein n=1 Tax=Stichopus japonicus TaxID=307972 RepID=A0A2G8JLT2_STIJA|nr:hypothetical protein BSL78_26474 [Apostichopus japonicus]